MRHTNKNDIGNSIDSEGLAQLLRSVVGLNDLMLKRDVLADKDVQIIGVGRFGDLCHNRTLSLYSHGFKPQCEPLVKLFCAADRGGLAFQPARDRAVFRHSATAA